MRNEAINRELLKQKADTLSESEVQEVVEYIHIMESLSEHRAGPDPFDEAILRLLSEAMRDAPGNWRSDSHRRPAIKN
ncbi:MAG TPA: hypothetical protein VLM38_24195 [Blastocatellia bacterium]|nr:hypothetical protein [Blastocatellia bacterium]